MKKSLRKRIRARWNGKDWVRQTPIRRRTFKVPAQPVRSTRAERQAAHKNTMEWRKTHHPTATVIARHRRNDSIATSNRHGGPHAHTREIARRLRQERAA